MAPKQENEVIIEAPRSEELVANGVASVATSQSIEVTPVPEIIEQPTAQEFVLEIPAIGPNVKLPLGLKTIEELAFEWDSEPEEVEKTLQAFRDRHPEEPIFKCKFRDAEEVLSCLSPEQVNLVQQENELRANSPPGAKTAMELSEQWDISDALARKVTTEFRKNHPEEEFIRDKIRLGIGTQKAWVYTPEQIARMEAEHRINEPYPEGTRSIREIAEELGVNIATFRGMVKKFGDKYPEQELQMYRDKHGYHIRLTPEQIAIVMAENKLDAPPPEGSKTVQELAEEWEVTVPTVRRRIDLFFQKHPDEERKRFKIIGTSKLATHLTPDQIALVEEAIGVGLEIPEGYKCAKDLEEVWGINQSKVSQILRNYRAQNPDDDIFEGRTDNLGSKVLYYSPEQLAQIEAKYNIGFPPPDGYLTLEEVSDLLGVSLTLVYSRVKTMQKENPEHQFTKYRKPGMAKKIYYLSPEQVGLIDASLTYGLERKETTRLEGGLVDYLAEVSESKTLEAQDFQKLIRLFGAERTVDILFQHRPEYQKIDIPYAKRVIGDYLGEFLVVRGDLELDNLELGTAYLSDPSLKEGLAEIIKNDCLKNYNQRRREGLQEDDMSVFLKYINDLRKQTANYSTEELSEVLDEVEQYYRALFEVVQIPDNIVDELEPGRLFPDINQRINILELSGKNKMLIADEMGVGKSASAILAKESLGVKQALVVVPSNVIEVWQKYLSDYKNGDGEAAGYFKEGQAPRVLTIDNGIEAFDSIDPSDYDYVIISQERLTDSYMAKLEDFDYDMLIVDEAHKLKNITSGKRAYNLVKLAEKIDGEDKYLALLSGTPVPNQVGDIAMVLKLLYPEKFEGISNKDLTREILNGDVLDLRSLLVPRMQMKSLAESVEMPKLNEELHVVEMSKKERDAYEVLLEEDEITATDKLRILRQFILNPEAFDMTPDLESAKIQEVGESLRSTFATKNKVVMFVNGYIENVIRGEQTIFDKLNLPDDVEVHVIDGKVRKSRRLKIQNLLQSSSDRKMLLAVSGQTADVGVDFSGAEELYFYNEPWTEYDKKQQQGRVYRPGLRQDLTSHTFYVEGSIEEGIHKYIEYKYDAVEKLLRGIPISELEREILKNDERRVDPNLEVNPVLAENYLSSWHRMLKIYNHVKEIGEENFVKFLGKYGREYAECYTDLGSRSYQANVGRLAGTVIKSLAKSRNQPAEFVRILDVASGPEMLKRHIAEEYQDQVVSVDINPHHFEEIDEKRRVGSFLNLPVSDSTVDYANLSLALHYTKFLPSQSNYERLEVFKELNRVLVNDGVAVINLMHNMDLKDKDAFGQAIEKVGFKVIEGLSGEVSSANNFKTRMLVLQKIAPCPQNVTAIVQSIGRPLLSGFKFTKTDVRLKDSRRIVTTFMLNGRSKIKAQFNQTDQEVYEEEQSVMELMKKLKKQYGTIRDVPKEVIYETGLARAFTGISYVLFKSLESGDGAVITR